MFVIALSESLTMQNSRLTEKKNSGFILCMWILWQPMMSCRVVTSKHREKHFVLVVWSLWIKFLWQGMCSSLSDLWKTFHNSGVSRIGLAETADMIRLFIFKLHVNYYWRELCEVLKNFCYFFTMLNSAVWKLSCYCFWGAFCLRHILLYLLKESNCFIRSLNLASSVVIAY